MALASGEEGKRIVSETFSVSHRPVGQVIFAKRLARTNAVSGKSLVPYRQCSACRNFLLSMLPVRSIVDTAICAKPLARWTYGDWKPPAES